MRGANGYGPMTTRLNREQDFAIFDTLPECVRAALNSAAFKYQAAEVAIQVRTFGAERIAAAIPASDASMIAKERARASAA